MLNFYFFNVELLARSWKIKKKNFESLIRKMKEQNLDLEVARDFFIEMKYTIQDYLKKMQVCWII